MSRSRFARQCANLWRVKQLLQEQVLSILPSADPVDGQTLHVIDSFPVRTYRVKRAAGAKLLGGPANFGYDPASMKDPFSGLT